MNKLHSFVIIGLSLLSFSVMQAQTVRDVISFEPGNLSGEPGPTPAQGRDGKLYGTFPNPEGGSDAVKFTVPTIAAGLALVGGGEANPAYYAPGQTTTPNANCTPSAAGGTCKGGFYIYGTTTR